MPHPWIAELWIAELQANEADDVRVFSLYSKANHETEPRQPLAELGNLTLESAFPQRIDTANRHSDNTVENKTSAKKWPHLPVNFVVAYDPDSTLATISSQPQLEMNSIFSLLEFTAKSTALRPQNQAQIRQHHPSLHHQSRNSRDTRKFSSQPDGLVTAAIRNGPPWQECTEAWSEPNQFSRKWMS
ncbi:hypothetical protein OAG60_00790 [bacterium]|nr:hypothetical protein [bacterium]